MLQRFPPISQVSFAFNLMELEANRNAFKHWVHVVFMTTAKASILNLRHLQSTSFAKPSTDSRHEFNVAKSREQNQAAFLNAISTVKGFTVDLIDNEQCFHARLLHTLFPIFIRVFAGSLLLSSQAINKIPSVAPLKGCENFFSRWFVNSTHIERWLQVRQHRKSFQSGDHKAAILMRYHCGLSWEKSGRGKWSELSVILMCWTKVVKTFISPVENALRRLTESVISWNKLRLMGRERRTTTATTTIVVR